LTKYQQIRKFEQKVKWSQDLHFVTIILINDACLKIFSDHLLNAC